MTTAIYNRTFWNLIRGQHIDYAELASNKVRLNAKTGLDTGSYSKEYGQLAVEMERLRALRQKLQDQEAQKVIRIQRIDELRHFIQEQETPLVRFDGNLFRRLVEKVRVMDGDEVIFVFKTGVEVKEELSERWG